MTFDQKIEKIKNKKSSHLNQEAFLVHDTGSRESLKVHVHTSKPAVPLHQKDTWPYFGAGKQTGVFYIPDMLGQDTGVCVPQKRGDQQLVDQPHHCSATMHSLLVLCHLSAQPQDYFVRQFFRSTFHNGWSLWVTGEDMEQQACF